MTTGQKPKAPIFSHDGQCPICERDVTFASLYPWFRDHLLCSECGSIPRERALMRVIRQYYPDYKAMAIHESSPAMRGVSQKLARECEAYSYSHYFADVAPGALHPERGVRCENLECLSFPDKTFDLFITQDVLEHVFRPRKVFREIARVLRPGGAHIFTVPLVNKMNKTARRAEIMADGKVHHLEEPQYHGNPVDPNGSLVVMDWGYDIGIFIAEAAGTPTILVHIDDVDAGIRAEYNEVVVSFQRQPAG